MAFSGEWASKRILEWISYWKKNFNPRNIPTNYLEYFSLNIIRNKWQTPQSIFWCFKYPERFSLFFFLFKRFFWKKKFLKKFAIFFVLTKMKFSKNFSFFHFWLAQNFTKILDLPKFWAKLTSVLPLGKSLTLQMSKELKT